MEAAQRSGTAPWGVKPLLRSKSERTQICIKTCSQGSLRWKNECNDIGYFN